MTAADPRCQVTTVDPASVPRSDSCVWCVLPAGHAGRHRAEIDQGDVVPAILEWRASVEPGVWLVADTSWGYDGLSQVVPFPTEVEAMRAANTNEYLRAYFVPFGTDLREAMKR